VPVGGRIVGGGGGAAAVAWKEEVNADFTTLSTQQFDHDDTFTLGGATWLVEEHDGTATRGIVEAVSGSGIKITPTGSDTNIYKYLRLPLVSTALGSAIAGLGDNDLICMQFFFNQAVTPAADFDGYGGLIYQPTGSGELDDIVDWFAFDTFSAFGTQKIKVSGGTNAGPSPAAHTVDYGTEGTYSGSAPTTFEMTYSFQSTFGTGASSSSASEAPAVYATSGNAGRILLNDSSAVGRSGSLTVPTKLLTAASARCGFGAFKVGSATAFHVFLKRIRILRAAGDAGGLG
jgi:hypothetical protein